MAKTPATSKKPGAQKITPAHISKIYAGLNDAGLGGFKIASMHLAPVADAAPRDGQGCHAVQLPNGHWTIVCD